MRRAFTLLEVIFTIFLASTVLISILIMLNMNIKNSEHLLLKREAINLAVSRLEVETYSGPKLDPPTGRFIIDIESTEDTPGIRSVTANILWTDSLKTNNKVSLSRTYYEGIN